MNLANIYEYDCEYDTRCNSDFGKTLTGLIGGEKYLNISNLSIKQFFVNTF